MKPVEECTYDELKQRLRDRLVNAIFKGELDTFLGVAIDLSIRWWSEEESRRQELDRRRPFYVRDNEDVEHSALNNRAKGILQERGLMNAKEVRQFLNNTTPGGVDSLVLLPNCGRRTANRIHDYYNFKA